MQHGSRRFDTSLRICPLTMPCSSHRPGWRKAAPVERQAFRTPSFTHFNRTTMKLSIASFALAMGLVVSSPVFAQAPAAAPAGSAGLCKDGSYTSNDTKKGACAGHKGVKDWFAVAPATSKTAAAAPALAAAAAAPTAAAPKAAPAEATKAAAAPSTAPAAGGGPGMVWVNTGSKVYHCAGTRYYGKTKQGEYMTEAAAKAAGDHADHGKSCAS
jgi:Protein of unknown function (DUF3761)